MHLPLTIFLTLAIWQTHAQIDLINQTSQRRDSSFLFQEVENHLEVTGGPGTGWKLKARNATVSATDSPRLFTLETSRLGQDTLELLQKGKVVLSKVFQVINIQNPVAHWGALTRNTASVPEVIANKRMTVFVPGCNCAGEWHIVSFSMNFVTDQQPPPIHIEGTILTPEAIRVIQRLRPGDKIIFNEIYAVCRTCRVREWPPFTITIISP